MSSPSTPIALSTSLRDDARFLRALARGLLHDEQLADDVVQEAWIAVLLKPPREAGGWRRWLAAIVRNLALRERRGGERRARREELASRGAAASLDDSAADVVTRGELQQLLVNAVMELPESQRQVVLLRYFDDLSSAEIARRHGVPDATVRTQLKRGLDRLRERLDARALGGRAAWVALLAPWAGKGGAAAGTSVAAWKVAGALALVAASAAVVVQLTRDPPRLAAPPPVAPLVANAPVETKSDEPAAAIVGRRDAAAGDEAGSSREVLFSERELGYLRGAPLPLLPPAAMRATLRLADGTPAALARVELVPLDDPDRPTARRGAAHSTRCDSSGAFRLDHVAFAESWRLVVSRNDIAWERPLDLLPGWNDVGTLLLVGAVDPRVAAKEEESSAVGKRPGAPMPLKGVVVDAAGEPVAGAAIVTIGRDGRRTALDCGGGRFALDAPRGPLSLRVVAPGFEAKDFAWEERPLAPLRLVLQRATIVRVEVVDEGTRRPPEGARFAALDASDRSGPAVPSPVRLFLAPSDRFVVARRGDGEFDVAVGSARSWSPGAWAPGFGDLQGERQRGAASPPKEASATGERLRLVLPRARLLAVRVVDAAGAPVSGATVVALGAPSVVPSRVECATVLPGDALAYAISDDDGIARLFGVAGETKRLSCWSEVRGRAVVALPAATSADRSLVVTLGPCGAIDGFACHGDGSPKRGATLRALGPDGSERYAACDADGRFRFESLPAGSFELRFASPLESQLIDAGDAWLSLDARGNAGRYSKSKHPDPWAGRFAPQTVVVVAGATAHVTLRDPAAAAGRIAGSVRFAGRPVAGARVQLSRTQEDGSFGLVPEGVIATTDGDGRFECAGLATPSRWRLMVVRVATVGGVELRGGGRHGQSVDLPTGGRADVVVELPSVAFRGSLHDAATGAPLRDVPLLLIGRHSDEAALFDARVEVTTDGHGFWKSETLPDGEWRASVLAAGYHPRFAPLPKDAATPLDLALEPGGWVKARPVRGSRFDVEVVRVKPIVSSRPEADEDDGVTTVPYDRPRGADGCFWLFAGDRRAGPGHLGWVEPGFVPRARVAAIDADGNEVAVKELELPLVEGAAPEIPLGD